MNTATIMVPMDQICDIIHRQQLHVCLMELDHQISAHEMMELLSNIILQCKKASTQIDTPKSNYDVASAQVDQTRYQSKNERTVANAIKQLGYTPYHNVIKKDCVGKVNPLPFDFGILVNGRELLIEFDGEHHEMPIKHFGGVEKAKEVALYDAIKSEYCKAKGIPLLRLNRRSSIHKELKAFIEKYEQI